MLNFLIYKEHWFLFALILILGGFLLVGLWRWLFALPKKHPQLLAYEELTHFTPYVVAELYTDDPSRLPWAKLLRFIASVVMGGFFFWTWFSLLLELASSTPGPPPSTVIKLGFFLLAALLSALFAYRESHRLKHYYQNTAFCHAAAISENELNGLGSDARGQRGEYYAWRLFQALPEPKQIIINPLVPKRRGSFAEIDLVVITGKGIFCVEAKNRSGTFIPNHYLDGRNQWVHVLPKTATRKAKVQTIENPFEQNERHIRALQNFWRLDRRYFFNVVCFGAEAELKRGTAPVSGSGLDPAGCLLYYGQREKLRRQAAALPDLLNEALIERLSGELNARCLFSRQRRESLIEQRGHHYQDKSQREKRELELALKRGHRNFTAAAPVKRRLEKQIAPSGCAGGNRRSVLPKK